MAAKPVLRLIREWAPIVVGALVIAVLIRLFLFQAYEIPSGSMLPTLEDGDRVVVNQVSYQLGEIERGQVIVFDRPPSVEGENDFIKRIIGLPGETIRLVDRQVYVDGLRVVEPYIRTQEDTRPSGPIPACSQSIATPDSLSLIHI